MKISGSVCGFLSRRSRKTIRIIGSGVASRVLAVASVIGAPCSVTARADFTEHQYAEKRTRWLYSFLLGM